MADFILTKPPVIATAVRYVPTSTLSGITLKVAPSSLSTPSIVIMSVPAPLIFAPISIRQFAKSITSGSLAAFSIVVIPSAKLAAIITFSVPVTLTGSNIIFAPFRRPSTFALIFPSTMLTSAPIALMASI